MYFDYLVDRRDSILKPILLKAIINPLVPEHEKELARKILSYKDIK